MNIGFDLDRIFVDYPPFVPAELVDWFYKNHSSRGLSYSIPHSQLSQIFRRLTHLPPLRPQIKKNVYFIKSFSAAPHRLFLISSRYKFLEPLTKNLLNRIGLKNIFSSISLNIKNEQPHFFKEKIIKTQKIQLYIDDDLELLKYLQKHCPKTKFLWYNPKNCPNTCPEISPITNLEEIKKFLK